MVGNAISHAIGGPSPAYSIGAGDVFINPALLTQQRFPEIQFSNNLDLAARQMVNIALSYPISSGDYLALGIQNVVQSGLQHYNSLENRTRSFDDSYFSVQMGYAREFSSLAVGAALQLSRASIYQNENIHSDSEFHVILGFIYPLNSDIVFGSTWYHSLPFGTQELQKKRADSRWLAGLSYAPTLFFNKAAEIIVGLAWDPIQKFKSMAGLAIRPISTFYGLERLKLRLGLSNIGNFAQREKPMRGVFLRPTFSVGTGIEFPLSEKRILGLDYCVQVVEYVNNVHSITTRIRF